MGGVCRDGPNGGRIVDPMAGDADIELRNVYGVPLYPGRGNTSSKFVTLIEQQAQKEVDIRCLDIGSSLV